MLNKVYCIVLYCISLTGLLFDLTMTSMKNLLLQTHLNQTIIALNRFSTLMSLIVSTIYRTDMNIANIDRPSFIAELCNVSEFSLLKRQTSTVTVCAL